MPIEVIAKIAGDLSALGRYAWLTAESLGLNYAVLTLEERDLPALYEAPEVVYFEVARDIAPLAAPALDQTCIRGVQRGAGAEAGLSGAGTLIGIIDSGIDYRHPAFRGAAGGTRIAALWDQSAGARYTAAEIDAALTGGAPLAHEDHLGHGTAVAGIAAGGGYGAGGSAGAAPEAGLVIVKLDDRRGRFARSTDLMRGVYFTLETARARGLPIAVNISYGYNEGGHDGASLVETYLDDISRTWRSVIVAAAGNEGAAGHHFSGRAEEGRAADVGFHVSDRLPALFLTLWKDFADDFSVELTAPNGASAGAARPPHRTAVLSIGGAAVTLVDIPPTHYNQNSGIYFDLRPAAGLPFVPAGVWNLRVHGQRVVDGRFDVWLPTVAEVPAGTAFLRPDPAVTLTLPSTAQSVITVGGHDGAGGAAAPFSGRGLTRATVYQKPDLTAPAVRVWSARAGGGYGAVTGTSYAAPFVTGAAALMMEWGIARGYNRFLYGQLVKAFLQKGARRDPARAYPNLVQGYGALCLGRTMDLLREAGRETR